MIAWYWRWTYGFTGGTLLTKDPVKAAVGTSAVMLTLRYAPPQVLAAIGSVVASDLSSIGETILGTTIARVIAGVSLGYYAGAVVGTILAQSAYGDEGAKAALDLYLDPVGTAPDFAADLAAAPGNLSRNRAANYAVDNNAGGYEAGTQINPNTGRPVGDIQSTDAFGSQALVWAEAYGV